MKRRENKRRLLREWVSDINKSIRHIHTSNVCSAEKCAQRDGTAGENESPRSGWNVGGGGGGGAAVVCALLARSLRFLFFVSLAARVSLLG